MTHNPNEQANRAQFRASRRAFLDAFHCREFSTMNARLYTREAQQRDLNTLRGWEETERRLREAEQEE